MGVCHLVLQILTLFQTKTCHFSHSFSDQASKIHTYFRPGLQEIMSSLLRLEHQMEDALKSTLKLYIALSFSVFIWNWNNKYTYIHSCSFLKIHTQFQTKMGKMYTIFRPKRPKNPSLWGSTNVQLNLSNADKEGTEHSVCIREVTMMMSFLRPHWCSLMLFIEWTMEQFELHLSVLIISCYSCI